MATNTHVVGVDLGATKIAVGLVDREGNVTERGERPTPLTSQADLLDAVGALVDPLLGPTGGSAVGLGMPGRFEPGTGITYGAVNAPIADLDLLVWARERFGVVVGVENDANAVALAEWRVGVAAGARTVVVLTLGTGVGGGLILDSALYRGWAEFGHIVVVADGEPCYGSCSGRGHLEAYVSGTAADRLADGVLGRDANAHDLIDAAAGGDEPAIEALRGIGELVGVAIGSLANIFLPDMVVIGGGFGLAAGPWLLEPALARARREALAPAVDRLQLVNAELGVDAGIVGAGLAAFDAVDGVR